MTALQTPPTNVQAPPFGNLTRYILTVKDHEDWVLEASEYNHRSHAWWDMNFDQIPNHQGTYWRSVNGWIKIENQGAVDFVKWETPFFSHPDEVYKLLRACMRRCKNYGTNPTPDEQKKIWKWAFENLLVYEIKFNLHTLTATKTLIDFKKDCCPKNISQVY